MNSYWALFGLGPVLGAEDTVKETLGATPWNLQDISTERQ